MKNFLSVLSSTLQGGIRGGFLILALFANMSAIYASDTQVDDNMSAIYASDTQVDDIWYDFDSSTKTASVTYRGSEYNSYSNEYSGSVIIPETVTYDGTTYSVTSIGKYAFYDCSSLVSVTIPNSVTHIGDHAFYKTSSLTSVNIPNSVTSIGDYAFRGCSSLTTIDIPNSLTEIAHGMFQDCSSLTTVTIPNSVTSIGQLAFDGCSSLTSITVPNSVISIGWNAFSGCRALTAITIPESITDIGSGAFASCSSLTSVVWNAKKCGQAYYDGYTHFEIELMDSTNYSYEEIGEFVKYFLDEGNIINNSPFHGCDGIKSFSFGENVEFIPDGLCYGLDGITSITIPESVSSIGERSFGECSSLDTIYCYSKDLPIMYLTDLHVHIVNIEMVYTYDEATPYIYDNTILYVPCQLLDAYKSQEEYTIRFPNIQCLEEDTPSQPQDQPTEGIGVFSVGEGKAVTFSRGNLQYTQSTNTWSFAENQYDYIGTDNVTGGSVSSDSTYGDEKYGNALADNIDLFGWSTSATNFGVSTSTSSSDYSGSFVDWGTNQIGTDTPNTWRTLTYDEWYYLRRERPNYSELCGVAQVNGVNGLVFLPDTWTCPKGVTFKSGFHNNDDIDYYAAYQTFTIKEWSKLEAAGAIFLPASGYRGGSYVGNVQGYGYYWSATEGVSNYAGFLYFFSGGAGIIDYNRASGRSVRLVKDVNNTTPEPPVEPQDTTIYHPTEYATICEGETYIWMGMPYTEVGTYTYEEIVEDENYIYHYIHTLELQVIAPPEPDTIVVEAYDSYEWHGKVYTESGTYIYEEHCYQEILQLTIIDTPTPPEPEIPTEGIGVFSVGEGKTVTFSRGNLQYTQSTNTWSFAENQWDMIGTDNVIGGSVESNQYGGYYKYGDALADKIDLFGWSTSATKFGVSTSAYSNDYSGSFVDWGSNQIGSDAPNTWRTLTYDEWYYLRYNRTNADNLVGVAQVNGVNGLIFLPDNWTCPSGITFKSGFHSEWGVDYYADYQTFTADQWSKLEAAGAVFLPASGYRRGSNVDNVQLHGHYWSATENGSYSAYCLDFGSGVANMYGGYRYDGQSVRLVKDVNSTTPEPPTQPQDTTIYHPTEYVAICEGETYAWHGNEYNQPGAYTVTEIVEEEDYIYHNIYTLDLTVIASETVVLVEEAYDSYEWHGKVYTESGTYFYEEWCFQEILELTIIPSEDKEYVYGTYYQDLVCNGGVYVDPITGENYLISSLVPTSLTWSDTVKGTEVDTIHTFNITPIVSPEPLTEDMLYAIGAVPKLVAGEKVDIAGTTELIMAYYQMVDQHDIADVIGVEWVAGHDVVLDTEQTTHTMVLEVWDECDYRIPKEFTFPVSKKDSEPQDTTICIYHTEDVTICEGETLMWMGMEYTEEGIYTYEEIVVEDDYIYHYIYTLHLMVLPPTLDMYEVTAYDSYEWHGVVYTESGVYTYSDPYNPCVIEELHLTIIPSEDNQGEVVVEPSTNSVTITWQKEDDADTYIIVIKQGDKVVCTLIFDAEGNLVSVNYLPGRESNKHGIQHAGLTSDSFQYTITGLTPSTDYTYTVTATDDSDNTISSYSGEFTTHHATSVENTNSPSPTIDCQKILYEDHIYILRDGKIYSIMGQEM